MAAQPYVTIRCDHCDEESTSPSMTVREARQLVKDKGWQRKKILDRDGFEVLADLCPLCVYDRLVNEGAW